MSEDRAWRKLAAVGVHTLTLSGAVIALGAIAVASEGDLAAAFLLLGLAVLVDGIDGPLARKLDVARLLQRWRGEILDLIVDYLTYVFVPAFMVYTAGLVPDGLNLFAGALICLSAGFYFADSTQKTEDNFFKGFPAAWNVVVFYIVVFALDSLVALAIIVLIAVAQFLPIRYVHPIRVTSLRPLTILMTVIWGASAMAAVLADLQAEGWAALGLLVTGAYFLGLSVLRASPLWRA